MASSPRAARACNTAGGAWLATGGAWLATFWTCCTILAFSLPAPAVEGGVLERPDKRQDSFDVPHYHYLSLTGVDTSCLDSDLRHAETTDTARLKRSCDADPECLGFNSRGVLKKHIQSGCLYLSKGNTLHSKTRHQKPLQRNPDLPIVPLPESWNRGTGNSILASNFSVYVGPTDVDVAKLMQEAADRYWGLTLTHRSSPISSAGDLVGLDIQVSDNSLDLSLDTDESYTLTVPSQGNISITAHTAYGALHAMETLSQLIKFDLRTGLYHIVNTPVTVTDRPRFAHRGILLDTSRHYHSVPMLKRFLDSMSHAKFNVFHWHIVDIQSFPLQLRTLPKLVEGAFTPQQIYTPGDVTDIVQHAKTRGIRVIPEFDTPGHASSWCVGHPEICPSATCTTPLNPATNKTFDLISALITESKYLFPDSFVHLGGDEVRASCWEKVPAVADWLKAKNYTTDDAYKYFVARTHAMARNLGRKSIHWEEVFNHFGGELDKDTIFQVWLNHKTAAKIVASGYQCILSNSNKWYLPHLTVSWQDMYTNDPFLNITDPAQQKLMLGGEACMWGETVDDSDLFSTVWPRAAAVAERLWSPAWANETGNFYPRLSAFRCLLNTRGYSAAAVNNKEARSAPPKPGSCEYQ